jgi:ABC-type Mn2+/Zn2+ transport system ATPase subunit
MNEEIAVSSTVHSLSARQLAIGYQHQTVVSGINLAITRGQSLALVGPNGSGKSTLLKTIVGLLGPLQGELQVLGQSPRTVTRRIGYLSQFHASGMVLPLRVLDVVRMGRFAAHGLWGRMTHEDEALVKAAMQTVGIATLANAALRDLSGGQQQRVFLAQVLAHQADLLVLDEPTDGLDVAGRERYLQAMRAELARGAAVVVATHDIQEAAACDQVLLLAGRVIGCGSPQRVLTPAALLETFGIVLTNLAGHLSLAVTAREPKHDHPHTPAAIQREQLHWHNEG